MRTLQKGTRVLVTGAGGFIGSALCEELLNSGAYVVAAVHHPSSVNVTADEVVFLDINDFNQVRDVISSREPEIVYHFAARAIVRVSANDPVSCYMANIMGTVNVLEACRVVGSVRHVVVASSDKAYGEHEKLPYTESTELNPRNTYDTSKACVDLIAQSYAHNYGLPVSVTRCSNVYGPGDPNKSRLIPNTVIRLLQGLDPVMYSDLEGMEREFIYIDDVVEAYKILGVNPEQAGVYNIGGTGPVEIKKLILKIGESMSGQKNIKIRIVQRDPKFKEIRRQYLDASKFQNAFGWIPKVNLDEGLTRTIEYYSIDLINSSEEQE